MIGKIVKGTSFSGCVNYVLKEDKSRLLKAVGVYGSPEEIAEQFKLQTLLNDKVKNTVGHISLSFSAEDGDRVRDDDGLMLKIAHDYMKLMGIENTQFIIARHTDRDHPHCHIVYNRVDNDGRTISDKNDRYRNEKVCKMLTARYRLHFAEGKEHVNFMRLRRHDRVKYFIYHALKREVPNARSWSELRLALRRYGIDTQWKLSRTTGEMQGVKFTCDQLTFSGSKIDRQFSFLNIDQELRYNALSATMNQRQTQAETIREEPRHEYQQENHSGISLGLFTPSPTDYNTEEAIQANRLKKKKKETETQARFQSIINFLLTIKIQIIMNYSDFIYDFNLYLCERFGYRNCCSVMHNANGICVSVHVGEMDLYIRFWEYSCGVGSIPDWSIIIVRSNFKRNQHENLKDLARFFKEYAPRYGYKYLCTEDDDYKYYQTLGLKLIHRGFFRQYNYGLLLKELEI